jgi:hypothetical protein
MKSQDVVVLVFLAIAGLLVLVVADAASKTSIAEMEAYRQNQQKIR